MAVDTVFAGSTSPVFTLTLKAPKVPWITSACILVSDCAALSLVFGFTIYGRHILTPQYHVSSYLQILACIAMLLGAFAIQGLYPGLLLHPSEETRRIFFSVSTVFLMVASTTFVLRTAESYSRSVFLVAWASGAPAVLLCRHATRRILSRTRWWGVPAIILGSGTAAKRVVRDLRNGMLGLRVTGVVTEEEILNWAQDMPPLLGKLSAASEIAKSRSAQYAIVAMPHKSSEDLRNAIQEYCQGFSHIVLIPDLQGLCSLGITARDIGGQVALEMPQRLFHRNASLIKRSLDALASGILLLLLAPLFLAIALGVKLTSSGPVFYGHSRRGRNGVTFNALKFRTMIAAGDTLLANYLAQNPEAHLEWDLNQKLRNDPRVTPIGKWLRRFSLDELPQLLNVAVGQMSLVGPRPIVTSEIAKYGRGYDLYARVRPGITGLWQVSGRNNTTYKERIAFDEYYVRNWSIWLDVDIFLRTVKVVLTGDGAY